jgi:secondary thiamine-phosphate synthase enzyme
MPKWEVFELLMEFTIRTRARTDLIDITGHVEKLINESGVKEGVCCIFVPHTTAAITLNEHADPDVVMDISKELSKIVPRDDNYSHSEGNSDAHIKTSIVGSSEFIPIKDGRLYLGTWQGIFFCEFDGPRTRRVLVKVIRG